MHRITYVALLAALALPAIAFAHGGGPHVMGTVKALDETGITVETKDQKDVTVRLDDKTKFENAGAPATAKDLATGERVVVHTAKNASGELRAILVKFDSKAKAAEKTTGKAEQPAQKVELAVTPEGFAPGQLTVKQGQPVDLVVTRKTDETCAKAILIPDYGVKQELPLNQAVVIHLVPKKTGEIKYSCGMGMMRGVLTVE